MTNTDLFFRARGKELDSIVSSTSNFLSKPRSVSGGEAKCTAWSWFRTQGNWRSSIQALFFPRLGRSCLSVGLKLNGLFSFPYGGNLFVDIVPKQNEKKRDHAFNHNRDCSCSSRAAEPETRVYSCDGAQRNCYRQDIEQRSCRFNPWDHPKEDYTERQHHCTEEPEIRIEKQRWFRFLG